jgi:hypothetical protein
MVISELSFSSIWYLYLDCEGGECVLLHSLSHWPKKIDRFKGQTRKLSTTERRAGCTDIYNTDNFYFMMEATSFEEFLIRVYFEEMAEWFIQYPPSDALPDQLQRHLRNVYTEKGRQW